MKKESKPTVATISWAEFDQLIRSVALSVDSDHFGVEVIVGILRGGAIPAVRLAHLLHVPTVVAIQVQTTYSDAPGAARHEPMIVDNSSLSQIEGKRVLLVDDVENTGATLRAAISLVTRYRPAELRIAVVARDTLPPAGLIVPNVQVAEYCPFSAHAWIGLPWNEP